MAFQSSYYVSNQETMSYSSGLSINYPWLHVMDDDAEEFVSGGLPYTDSYPRNVLGSFYHWGADPFLTLGNAQYRELGKGEIPIEAFRRLIRCILQFQHQLP